MIPKSSATTEEQHARALAAEKRARIKAETDLVAKSELLATVSHELRTPLGTLIAMADLLLTTALDQTQRHYASTLQQSARNLIVLLNDVLDHEKLAAGRFELAPRDVDLDAFLNALETSLDARARTHGISGYLERARDLPRLVTLDPVRLRQIIDNLLDNAVKFTDQGSVTLRVSFDHAGSGPGKLRVAVADTGIGMNEEERENLFKPFAQAHPETGAKYGGTGLGLSIVAKLVNLMQGTLSCTSKPDEGSIFTAIIPCPLPSRDQLAAKADTLSGPETTDTRGILDVPWSPHPGADDAPNPLKVLIVDDNKINQTLLATFLATFGMDYQIVSSGNAALEALRNETFDAVLMDIRMRGLDGIETTQKIRALEEPASLVPVIAITADALKGDREKILSAGLNGYVSKPIDPRVLYQAIAEATANRPPAQRVSG